MFREISETKAIFGTFVNVDRSSNPHDYYCVFLKNEEIEAIAFYQKENLPVYIFSDFKYFLIFSGHRMRAGIIRVWNDWSGSCMDYQQNRTTKQQ